VTQLLRVTSGSGAMAAVAAHTKEAKTALHFTVSALQRALGTYRTAPAAYYVLVLLTTHYVMITCQNTLPILRASLADTELKLVPTGCHALSSTDLKLQASSWSLWTGLPARV
jgi:hypothetical protein